MDLLERVARNLIDRVTGPLSFRFILQPTIATIFAAVDGFKDAKAGREPYFWLLGTTPGQRAELLQQGWKSVRNVFLLALVLDGIYQIIALHFIYPGELIIVAFTLAILPYLVMRGLVTRLLRRKI
jgi:hypothetical protein